MAHSLQGLGQRWLIDVDRYDAEIWPALLVVVIDQEAQLRPASLGGGDTPQLIRRNSVIPAPRDDGICRSQRAITPLWPVVKSVFASHLAEHVKLLPRLRVDFSGDGKVSEGPGLVF